MTEHLTRQGACKIVENCSYPLTGMACIDRIYTDMAVMDVTPGGIVVRELFGDVTPGYLQEITPVKLTFDLTTQTTAA
jgi:3-oxoadipate CoA-transferase beta subunit